jgi:hypothetical protein
MAVKKPSIPKATQQYIPLEDVPEGRPPKWLKIFEDIPEGKALVLDTPKFNPRTYHANRKSTFSIGVRLQHD